jgi:glycosyltransferase
MKTDILPLVSIITTSYNSEKTIRDTLASIAMQDYPRIEHIIVDGASTDHTLAYVAEYPHVANIISEPDSGIYDAMNKGLRLCTGEIIGILNSDDFYVSGQVVGQVVDQMEKSDAEALYGDLVYVHPEQTNKIVRTWIAGNFRRNKFLFGWMPPHPAFFVRRHVYEQLGPFNTGLRSAADYELMLRFLFKSGISVVYLPKVLVKMRAGGMSNATLANRIRANREDRQAWRVNDIRPYFFTTWLKPMRKLIQFIHKPNAVV